MEDGPELRGPPVDPWRLRAFHAAECAPRVAALRGRTAPQIAEGCRAAIADLDAWLAAHGREIESAEYGSFARFVEVYAGTLARFREVAAQSFALDDADPGGLFGEAAALVARALPCVDDPRAFAVRALAGRPPFEPPGPLARRLLDLRAALADLERWKQREFLEGWMRWAKLVFLQDLQAAALLCGLGDRATRHEVTFTPFDARVPRLLAAKARRDAAARAAAPEA